MTTTKNSDPRTWSKRNKIIKHHHRWALALTGITVAVPDACSSQRKGLHVLPGDPHR